MSRRSDKSTSAVSATHRLRRMKAALLAVSLTLAGILLMMLNGWLHSLPLGELGGTLFGAGLLSALFEYSFRRAQEAATVAQFRRIIREQAPAMRDAVVEGFAVRPEDLKRVANPELLDDLASNAMSLRLGDEQFAREIYRDIRDQAIAAAERWHDVEVRIRLSSALERSTSGTPLFDVTVEAEYTMVPPAVQFGGLPVCQTGRSIRRCAKDATTSAWLVVPRPGMDARRRQTYQLLEFSVDGVPQTIRRSSRRTGQLYTVHLTTTAPGQPVRIRTIVRTVTPQWGHRLFFELPQPARGTSIILDYTDTTIASMRVSDTVSTVRSARISHTPEAVPGKVVSVEVPGWLLSKAGFAFTWTLEAELPRGEMHREVQAG